MIHEAHLGWDGPCQLVAAEIQIRQLRQEAHLGWDGPCQLVVGEIQQRQLIHEAHLGWDSACQLVAVEIQTRQTRQEPNFAGNRGTSCSVAIIERVKLDCRSTLGHV